MGTWSRMSMRMRMRMMMMWAHHNQHHHSDEVDRAGHERCPMTEAYRLVAYWIASVEASVGLKLEHLA